MQTLLFPYPNPLHLLFFYPDILHKITESAYILVAESEDDDAECLILKDVRDEESGESVYEIVENEKELQAVSKVFEELLEDVSIEL